jgi:hypothetical protein
MGKSIKLFMWGYQPHFRMQMESRAKDVLQTVAPTLEPRVLLVGVRTPESTTEFPVCVEPEDDDWDPSIFFDCFRRTVEISAEHPDNLVIYGDAPRMRDKPENVRKKSAREAVQEVASAYDKEHGTHSFCGWSARLGDYHVVPIIQLQERQLQQYPRLASPIQFLDWNSSLGFVDSIVNCLLEEATLALGGSEPGRYFDTFRVDKSAVLRDAGDRFCSIITLASRDVAFQGVFDALNVVSSLPYEGAEAIGRLLLVPADTEAVEVRVRLNDPVRLHDHRLARKLIEMSGQDLLCVCQGSNGIIGLGTLRLADADNVFLVSFSGHYKWELHYKSVVMMKGSFGVPQLPSVRLDENTFHASFSRVHSGIEAENTRRVWGIVEAAMEQRHGTMIVISANAEQESKRLRKQSLGIAPTKLTPELVKCLSGIDGAILIDPRGVCYGIGVILDGIATDEGDPSRGARYNSAIRYITSSEVPVMCLVVSEDGYVNMFPRLLPQVSKADIEKRIEWLKTKTTDNYHKTFNWLNNMRFYLTQEQCNEVNLQVARIYSAPQQVGEVRFVIEKFVPHPKMNESYYLPESS